MYFVAGFFLFSEFHGCTESVETSQHCLQSKFFVQFWLTSKCLKYFEEGTVLRLLKYFMSLKLLMYKEEIWEFKAFSTAIFYWNVNILDTCCDLSGTDWWDSSTWKATPSYLYNYQRIQIGCLSCLHFISHARCEVSQFCLSGKFMEFSVFSSAPVFLVETVW